MANTEKKYVSLETLTSYDGLIKTYITTEIDESVSTKSNSDHTHVISDVTNLQTELDAINSSLAQKSQVQIITPESTESLLTLHIHKLTQEEYDEKVASGEIDENALYLTPDEETDLSGYATVEQLGGKANAEHTHNAADVTDLQSKLDGINSEIDGCITGLSVSGQTITYTKNDGSTGTIITQDENTDTNVTNTLATTIKAYVTGTTSNITNTGTQVFDTGVYLDVVAGQLVATTFKGDLTGNADSATKAVQDGNGNIITTTYETKADAVAKLEEAKSYTDSVKNSLLNGAGGAYDTLKELGDLIDDNTDAIDALEIVANGKADAVHSHNDLYYMKSEINDEISTINSSISASTNEAKQYAAAGDTTTLEASKIYADNAVAQKSQVQIITWGADD